MKTYMNKNTSVHPILQFLAGILFCELVGNIPTPLTISAIDNWYATLNKPFFNPPNWLFGPVWTVLFLLMGISLTIVWQKRGDLRWFWIQLALNVVWSLIFFGLQNPGMALIEILTMWLTIIMTIRSFRKLSRIAAYLLLPYLGWVTFAALLNAAIWWLN